MAEAAKYAVIRDGKVVNVILWDGKTEYDPGEGVELVELPAGAGIGWSYVKGEFAAPPPPPEVIE